MTQTNQTPETLASPRRMFTSLVVVIIVAEALVMLLLSFVNVSSEMVEALADAFLLTILIAPALYALHFIPVKRLFKHAEHKQEALRESEEKHRAMISNISDVIAIMGSDGIIKYKSTNIERWFGWTPEDLVGTDGWATVHPDDLERIQKEFRELLCEDTSTTTVEYRYKCKDGGYKPIELTAVNLVNDSTVNGVLLNYSDITERKRAEVEKERLIHKLRNALEDIKILRGIVPICSHCKKIRDDKGYWSQVEVYVSAHSEAEFSHGICPDCIREIYPELADEILGDAEDDKATS